MAAGIILTLCFFLASLAVYYNIPVRYRWLVLLCASMVFYMSVHPWMIALVGSVTIISWLTGMELEKVKTEAQKRRLLGSNVLVLLFLLFLFKYFHFFTKYMELFLQRTGLLSDVLTLELVMPLGISYYTFKIISYLADVKSGRIRAESHLGYYAVYVLFFPQILCGPIERAEVMLPQIRQGCVCHQELLVGGMDRILVGMFKKLVIANRLSLYVNTIYAAPEDYPGLASILAFFFYSFEIYCDFSGYSDISIGMAEMFGIRVRENFRFPYFSRNIKEFWNRWHISLSAWLRDYIYIPLGGNREGDLKKDRNMLLTFLASGLWHGNSLSFVFWGGIHGFWNLISVRREKPKSRLHELLQILITFTGVTFSWIFFRADSMNAAVRMICHAVLDFRLSFTSISASVLPFSGDNTCVALLLTAVLMIALLILFEIGEILEKNRKTVWRVIFISCVALFGIFGNYGFLYAQF